MKPELPPWIGPAGSGVVAVSVAAWICASILPWMRRDVALEMVDVGVDLVERRRLLVADGVEVGLAGLELRPGALELGLLGRDLVAVRLDPFDGLASVVAKRAHVADDRRVLLLDPSQILVSGHQVVEAVGLQHHGDHVRLPGPVDVDEPVAEHVQRPAELVAELLEAVLLDPQSPLHPVELGLDDRLAVAEHGHLAGELAEPVLVSGELRREHSLAALLLAELRLLRLELRLQVLARGSTGDNEPDDTRQERGEPERRWALGAGRLVSLDAHPRSCRRCRRPLRDRRSRIGPDPRAKRS